MITISISGYGTYEISAEKLQELLNWISANSGVRTQSNESNKVSFQGRDLLNG